MNITLKAQCAVRVNEIMFFFTCDANILFSYNLENEKIEILGSIPESDLLNDFMCTSIHHWNGKLYLVPLKMNALWIYHIEDKKWESLDFLEEKYRNDGMLKFWQATLYQHKLYMFGCQIPQIVKIDLKTLKKTIIDLQDYANRSTDKLLFNRGLCKVDNYAYVPGMFSNEILKINLDDDTYEWIAIGKEENRYADLDWDGEKFWLGPNGTPTYVCWSEKGEVLEYSIPQEFLNGQQCVLNVVAYEDVVLLGGSRVKSLEINRNHPAINKIVSIKYGLCMKDDKYIILIDEYGNVTLKSRCGNTEQIFECKVEKRRLYDEYISDNNMLYSIYDQRVLREGNIISLKDYQDSVAIKGQIESVNNNSTGESIYRIISKK